MSYPVFSAHDEQLDTMQHVRFLVDIPIEPSLLDQSLLATATDDVNDSSTSGSEEDEESVASAGSELNARDESDIPLVPADHTDIHGLAEDFGARRGSRSNDGPRRRGRGGGLSRHAGKNPLHVREPAAPKGSKPRGSRKGVKKGPRKAMEPSVEFKALKSRATLEYINGNFEEARDIVEEAISLNPEIFSAYALLSSIHQALGDEAKAVAALFQGAHTTPRNTEIWNSVAQSILEVTKDRSAALRGAEYCYTRVITTDKDNIEARTNRAPLYVELGRYLDAIRDFKHLLRITPHHLDTLRSLSECCSLVGTPTEAIVYYDGAIEYYRAQNSAQGPAAFWSDANIYAELYLMAKEYRQGLFKVKQVARWMLGRGLQSYWDEYYDDDREFDADDSRRREVLHDDAAPHDKSAYGLGLPMELRIKLGLLRIKLGPNDYNEAMWHFAWLDPAATGNEDSVLDYADLVREIAATFKSDGYYEQAAHFLQLLKSASDLPEVRLNVDLGRCYLHLERYTEAEMCFNDAVDADEHDLEGYEELLKLFSETGNLPQAVVIRSKISARRRAKRLHNKQGTMQINSNNDPDFPVVSIEDPGGDAEEFEARMLAPPPKKAAEAAGPDESPAVGKRRWNNYELTLRDMVPAFQKLHDLEMSFQSSDHASQLEWMTMAKDAVDHLRAYKPFWPADRYRPFAGYTKHSNSKNLTSDSAQVNANSSSDTIPDSYCGIQFADWLACSMRYVLRLSIGFGAVDSRSEAYSICKSISTCSIWYGDKETQFLVYIVWSLCAVQKQDHETLCEVSRFFSKQYQFVSDSYRMYGALNRLCGQGNKWYNISPSQKYMLRHIKAMDLCLIDSDDKMSSVYDERAPLTNKDEKGNIVTPKAPDVALLLTYGHMLFTTSSYAFALHYFIRAHDVEPNNPMTLLSLALGYTHYAVSRKAENRQALIACGLTYLFRYLDVRKLSSNPLHHQEAEYNVGRTFHFLGLPNLAIPYYERCLALSGDVEKLSVAESAQNFAREAAFALRGFYAQAGDLAGARRITETWLWL